MESQQVQSYSSKDPQTNRCFRLSPHSLVLSHREKLFKVSSTPMDKQVAAFEPYEDSQSLSQLGCCNYLQIYGIIKLKTMACIALVTSSTQVGEVKGKPIFKVGSVEVLPIGDSQGQEPYLDSFRKSFCILGLYYSAYDLTQRLQFGYEYPSYYQHSLFCNFSHTLRHQNFPYELLTKFIFGFAATETVRQEDTTYKLTLISRGNYTTVGRRWLRRGLNDQGEPANHYETECLLQIERGEQQTIYSIVQTRGSLPLLWQQTPNFSLTAPFSVCSEQSKVRGQLARYVEKSEKIEKRMAILNLVNKRGPEGALGELLEQYFRDLDSVHTTLLWFDYHAEYGTHKQACFNHLAELLRHDLSQFGYLKLTKNTTDYDYKLLKTQQGVVRTNCIDCLDRTNFVQSLLAKVVLLDCLDDHSNRTGLLNFPLETLEVQPLELAFKSLWKRNAAAIAVMSTGASAMKMDFYGEGRRTVWGQVRDFGIGSRRYYMGLFSDYYYQNLLDLHFQKLLLEGELSVKGTWKKTFALLGSVAAVAGASYGVFRLVKEQAKEHRDKFLLGIMGSAVTTLAGLALIKHNHQAYLQRPIIRQEYL